MTWWNFIKAVFRGDHKLAPTTWVMAVITVVYTISPVDFIPEIFLGPLGLIDDLGLWGALIALAAREKSRYEVATAPQNVHAERLS